LILLSLEEYIKDLKVDFEKELKELMEELERDI